MDDNSRFRRLAKLGVYGHQPGIAAHVKTTLGEEQEIAVGILGQKVGSNPKSVQACKDFFRTSSEEDSGTIKVKIARLSTKSIIKWNRIRMKEGEEGPTDRKPAVPSYTSRLLTCSMRYQTQETWWMQLRTSKGFRATHCKYCKYQEYTARTNCQCGVRWHHCQVHRIDPLVHASKRGRMKPKAGKCAKGKKIVSIKSSLRAAPILVGGATKAGRGARRKTLRKSMLPSHAIINRTAYSPGS